jgi:hypothetical protein
VMCLSGLCTSEFRSYHSALSLGLIL